MWTVMFGSLACTGGRRLRHDGKYYLDGEDGNTYLCQRTGEPPEPPEPQISDNEAVAIITDTLTTSEALNIITGGNE